MEEIKTELRQDNVAVKANAVAKLTYVCIIITMYLWLILNLLISYFVYYDFPIFQI